MIDSLAPPSSQVTPAYLSAPQLRSDLEIVPQDQDGATVYLVHDRNSGRYLQWREVEHSIASQFDGKTSLEKIRRGTEAQFLASIPLEILEQFVAKLGTLGLLVGSGSEAATNNTCARRSLLHWRIPLFNPDRLLGRMEPRLRFVFSPLFVAGSTAGILFAGLIIFVNEDALTAEFATAGRIGLLIPALLLLVGLTLVHEFAHGLTCKHFGGPVQEIGLLFLMLHPALYCDVSSAWRFNKKQQRMWVTFAGIFSDLIFWAIAVVVWRITAQDSWLHTLSLLVIATTGLRCLFNLNPLIKLDGYYLLSDWIEIPNLRQRSFEALRRVFYKTDGNPDRSRGAILFYGIVATLFSSVFLMGLILAVGSFLMEHYQAWGLLVFVGLCGLLFGHRLVMLLSALVGIEELRKGNWRSSARRLVLMVAVPISAYGIGQIPWELRVVGEVSLMTVEANSIRSPVGGVLQEVLTKEGDCVLAGQTIARLSDPDLVAEAAQVEAELREAQAQVDLLRAGPRLEQITLARAELATADATTSAAQRVYNTMCQQRTVRCDEARAKLERAQVALQAAQKTRDRTKRLAVKNFVTESEIDQAEKDLNICKAELAAGCAALSQIESESYAVLQKDIEVSSAQAVEARGRLELLLAGSPTQEIAAAEAKVARLKARWDWLQHQLQDLEIHSPIAGVVTTRLLERKLGSRFEPGDLIAEVQQTDRLASELIVSEKDVADVASDQSVVVKLRAWPDKEFPATVTAITPVAIDPADESQPVSFLVTTYLSNPTGQLRPGMTGKARISCGERTVWELAKRRVSQHIEVDFWSWW